MNADHENDRNVYFHFNEYVEQGFNTKMHYIHSDSYLDANTYKAPEKVRVRSKDIEFSNEMTFPKHSVSIISLPKDVIKTGIDTGSISNITIINNTLIWRSEEEIEDYQIYDYLGNSIDLPVISRLENEIRFKVNQLSKGAYFLNWQSKEKEGTEKFIR